MKEVLQQTALEALQPIATVLMQLLSAALIGVITLAANALRKKLNIDVDQGTLKTIQGTVTSIVEQLNQQIVDDLKAKSADGKLTAEEQEDVLNRAKNLALKLLDDKSKEFIRKHYGDEMAAIELLVESAVRILKKTNPKLVSLESEYTPMNRIDMIPVQQYSEHDFDKEPDKVLLG